MPATQIKALAFLLRSTNRPFGGSHSGIILPQPATLLTETNWAEQEFVSTSIPSNMSEARNAIATQHAEIELTPNSRIIDPMR
jgi:hypothetical protein